MIKSFLYLKKKNSEYLICSSHCGPVADLGFHRGGGANQEGHITIIWPIFLENCMKMKKIWARREACPLHPPLIHPPLDPPLWTTATKYDHSQPILCCVNVGRSE